MSSMTLNNKGKPHLSNSISIIPRGISKKEFRVAKSVSKKDLTSPYLHDKVRIKSKSQMSRSIARKSVH